MAVQLNVAELGVTKDEVMPVGALQILVAIVKLVLLISKNIFPTDSILILAVVELITGMTIVSIPSFGVLADNIIGKLNPPSVLNEIFTLAQFTGETVVPATFHVMACELPANQETAVFGEVTTNGPAAALTVTVMSVKDVCPTLTGAVDL